MNAINSTANTEFTDDLRWNLLQRKAQEIKAVQAFELFREHNIEPVLIKGLAVGRFYPEFEPRLATDTDLAVSASDFDRANKLARSSAAIDRGLAIDLHRELRKHDTADWDDLFQNSILIELDGGTVRVLRDEDHLRVLIVHWLTDGGTQKQRLYDIYYLIKHCDPEFDWDRFLNTAGETRRRWFICTLGLAHRYLGLDLDDTPVKNEALDLPRWLIRTVEREWASKTEYIPIEFAIHDKRKLATQIIKRLRPNPIRATVQAEGSFDARTRIFYIIQNNLSRIVPTVRRILGQFRPEQPADSNPKPQF